MLSTDGFWNAVSSLFFWLVIGVVVFRLRSEIVSIFKEKQLHLKIGDKEVSITEATHSLGNYVTDIQKRLADIENKIESYETKINCDSDKAKISNKESFLDNSESKRILWVDDFPSNNAFIVDRIQNSGINVDISLGTKDAIGQFTAFDHKIIISDLGRVENGIDNPIAGLNLIESIRRINKTVPILIFAGQRGMQLREKLLAAGASEVTTSGVDVMKFIEKYLDL